MIGRIKTPNIAALTWSAISLEASKLGKIFEVWETIVGYKGARPNPKIKQLTTIKIYESTIKSANPDTIEIINEEIII